MFWIDANNHTSIEIDANNIIGLITERKKSPVRSEILPEVISRLKAELLKLGQCVK